jgi:hypothetical protein
MMAARAIALGMVLAMSVSFPAASQPKPGSDHERLIGIWRLVSITTHGKINPLRGAKPTGYIFYTASGEMAAMIKPDRPPVTMAGKQPTGEEALAALKGFTSYWGTYTIDEKAKIVTHHRKHSVQPGHEPDDARRAYRFEGNDRLVLGGVGSGNANTWERVK